jgi:glycosyltransferase involved in cell wall biosynthesis
VRPQQVVVVDDGSRDGTADLVEALRPEHEGLVVVRSAHVGRAAARNLGIARLTTDLVAVQDADDVALPWRLEDALVTFTLHPDAVAVGAQMLGFHRAGYAWEMPRWPVAPEEIARTFAAGTMAVAHPTVVMRRDAADAAGGYDESFAYGEDLTLLMRMSAAGAMASSSRDVTLYRKPRRHSFGHMLRTDLATRRARLVRDGLPPRLPVGQRAASLLTIERAWLRQRLKPMPAERPFAELGVDPGTVT